MQPQKINIEQKHKKFNKRGNRKKIIANLQTKMADRNTRKKKQ